MEIEAFKKLGFKPTVDGIPFEKIKYYLEAGLTFTISKPGQYVLILQDGRVFLKEVELNS